MGSKQEQSSGDDSLNVQAGRDVAVSVGLTYSDVRQVALDIFRMNFLEMRAEAAAIATDRATKLIDSYLDKLPKDNPKILEEAKNPDLLQTIYSAEKSFARTGDPDLGEVLVGLLVDRTVTTDRNLLQIVLNESVEVAPKLTTPQLDILSLIFLHRYTKRHGLLNLNELRAYFLGITTPYVASVSDRAALYQHLEYAGCGKIQVTHLEIESTLRANYPHLFNKGFSTDDARAVVDRDPATLAGVFIPALHDSTRLQLAGADDDVNRKLFERAHLTAEQGEALLSLATTGVMSETAIRAWMIVQDPSLHKLFMLWSGSPMKNFDLTSVGIAIAHANIKRRTGENINLSIWI